MPLDGFDPQAPLHPETVIQHWGEEDHILGAVTPPIFQNSLFVYDKFADLEQHLSGEEFNLGQHAYSRLSNPTLEVAEKKLAKLESCDNALLFSSGMGAISAAIMSNVQQGGHVVCVETCYGPTKRFLSEYLPAKGGIETTFVDGCDPQEIVDAVQPGRTSLIYLESPSSLVFKLQDLAAIGSFARDRGIKTAIDNTYSTPFFQRPHELGIDLVLHTASKYMGGHSDLIGGVICGTLADIKRINGAEGQWIGGRMSPFVAWLLLRGLRSLGVRLERAQLVGNRLAETLLNCPQVVSVNHLGLESHPQHQLVKKQMSGTVSLLSFKAKRTDKESVVKFIESLDLFQIGVSWGGFESLAVPARESASEDADWIVRLYGGLESIDDLCDDVRRHIGILG